MLKNSACYVSITQIGNQYVRFIHPVSTKMQWCKKKYVFAFHSVCDLIRSGNGLCTIRTSSLLTEIGFSSIDLTSITNHVHMKLWDMIIYPFLNFDRKWWDASFLTYIHKHSPTEDLGNNYAVCLHPWCQINLPEGFTKERIGTKGTLK